MFDISRREFIGRSSISLALAANGLLLWPSHFANAAVLNKDNGREFLLLANNHKGDTQPGSLQIMDVGIQKITDIRMPFMGHKAEQNPARKNQVVIFEKWGRRAVLIDIVQGKIIASAEAGPGNMFYGHGVFDPDGSAIFVTETTGDAADNGRISVRDPGDLSIKRELRSYGIGPHECRMADGGKTIIAMNEGNAIAEPSNLAWIDAATGALVKKVDFDFNDRVCRGHFDISYDNWIGAIGRGQPESSYKNFPLISFISPDGRILKPEIPDMLVDFMTGEALSLAFIGHSGLAAITLADTNMLVVMDYKQQKLVDQFPIAKPKAVIQNIAAKDAEHSILVSSGVSTELLSVTANGNDPAQSSVVATNFGGKGSHLTRIYV